MKPILSCDNVYKNFGKKKVLKGISFTIEKGDILAFIGPNGSGKTTTIKLILGLQPITKGTIKINGYDISDEKEFIKAIDKVGSIVENPDSYMYLTGYQNLKLIANLYSNCDENKINDIVKLVGLENRINDKVKRYSLGMRQRLGIAKALLMDPNLLVLDEPTNGLDPEGIRDLRNLLKKLASKGLGVLISSHNLSELESFCNKVCIISSGEVIEKSEVNKLKKIDSTYIFKLSSTKDIKLKNIKIIDDETFEIVETKENINKIIKDLIKQDISIYEIKIKEITLEEAFLEKTGGNKID